MNFLGIVKNVGKYVGIVGAAAAPEITLFNPALGAIVTRVSSAINNAEAQIPEAGQGPTKAALVVGDFNTGLAMAQSLLKLGGKQITYDAGLLDKAIAAQVTAMNTYADLARSIKLIEVTPAAGQTIVG